MRKTKTILFVCTGNSARSIIAESIINNNFRNQFIAFSAGSNPSGKINPYIKEYLEGKKFNLDTYYSKNFDEFLKNDIDIDYVITVCNNANKEVCPVWPKKKTITHWDIEDPVEKFKKTKNKDKINLIAEETYNIINEKIKHWIKNEK